MNVVFSPTSTGPLTGTLTINGNVAGGSVTASLSGTGTAPPDAAISFTPTSLSFAALNVNSTSAVQSIQVSNTGTAALVITNVSLVGDFSESDNCNGANIAIGASCTINVKFTPLEPGALSGTITVSGNVAEGSESVTLTGTGVAIGVLSPNIYSLHFGQESYGSTTPSQTVLLQNTGTAPLQIGTVATTGNFSETDNCAGNTLAVNATCSVQVVFTPLTFGSINGSLTVSSNASDSTVTVTLSGFATSLEDVTATVSPTSLTFPSETVGTTSNTQNVTLAVTSTGALNPPSIVISGDYAETDTCQSGATSGTPCLIGVRFTPTAAGTRNGALTVSGNITGGPLTALLTGTGANGALVTATPTVMSFPDTNVGSTSAAQYIVVANTGNVSADCGRGENQRRLLDQRGQLRIVARRTDKLHGVGGV